MAYLLHNQKCPTIITIKHDYNTFESGFLEKRCEITPHFFMVLLFLGKLVHSRSPFIQPSEFSFLTGFFMMTIFILFDFPVWSLIYLVFSPVYSQCDYKVPKQKDTALIFFISVPFSFGINLCQMYLIIFSNSLRSKKF